MADCSHPPHRNRGLAKNLSSVFGFGSKGVYDDVFVARPQMRVPSFTPVVRDYAEVFNCSQTSSIPVLELDEFDLGRSSKVDYGNVFMGLGDSQIGSDFAEVFCVGDGVRRTDDSHAHSRGLDRSTTLENSQKLTHESLHGKKRTISYDKTTLGGKDETDETTGQAKKFEVQVCVRAIDGTIPLKRAEASGSGATTNNFKQYSDEVLVGKHSRNVSSGGLSKHDADGFIEIDLRSRNGYDSDKSTSSGMPMEANLIRSKEQIFEVITPSVSIMHLGSPNATFKEQAGLKSNASEDQCGGCNSPSREDVKVQNMDNPFVRDCAVDERAAMHISVGSKVISSSGLSQDLNDACVTSEILMGNSNACSNNASEKAKDDTYYSQQDVTFQTITSSERSFISNSLVETSVFRPQEISKSTPATHSQHNYGNIALEVDIVPKIVASRNAYSECADTGYGHLTNNVESQNQVALDERTSSDVPVDTKVINLNSQNSKVIPPSVVRCSLENVTPAVRKATISKSSELRKSTYSSAKDNHSPSSSDDEIDKNSEAAISAAAVKKAIREAQAWINIAKESKGVKGFMKPVVAKTFRQVKVLKDVHFSKETVKSFELGQTTIENNCSTSASTKYFIAPLSTSSEIKMAPTNTVGEERDFKGTEFCISDELHQVEGVLMQTFSKKLEYAPAIQNATPSINTLEERLTVYSTAAEEKLLKRKEDTTMQDLDDSGQPTLVEEANTVMGVTKAENEFQETMNKCYQGFMMHSFHDNFGKCKVGRSAISFEVKEDLVSGREHMAVHTKQNEAIKAERECLRTPCIDNSEEDLASLEKENVKESKLDPHDLVSDCEDMGLQDYASAEENLVSSDTDHEIDEKYPNLPTQYQLDEVEATTMQNMVGPEVIVITEDVLALCFKKLNVEPLVEESDESEDISLQIEVTPETKVTPEETTVPFFDYSNECPVVEETYESEAMPLQNKVTHEVTSGAGTRVFFNNSNEDAIVEESEVMLDVPMLKIVTPELKITPEDGLAPSFNYTKEDPRIEDTGVEDMTEQNMVIPEANIISKDDVAPSFDNSNEDLMVEEIEADTTGESGVKALEQGHEKVVGAATLYIHEHTTLDKEEAESFSRVESASGVNHASSHSEGSDGKLISTNCMTTSVADAVMESRSMPWTCDNEKQEVDAENFLDLKLRTEDREELHDVSRVEAEILQQGHETMNVEGLENDHVSIDAERQEDAVKFESIPLYPEHVNHENEKQDVDAAKFGDHKPRKQDGEELNDVSRVEAEIIDQGHETMSVEGLANDQVSIDAAKKEDAIDLESIPLYPEHVNHELEAGIQFCEPLRDTNKNEETDEFEQQGENLIQHVKKQERKKWEIPRETFELPELKTVITEIQDIKKQDSFEVERQMDKHDRKKWEIPRETFELPVLGDDVVDVEQDWEKFTQSAEKPERKKWKIQKEVLEIPILCAETVQETSEQDGFVVKTAPEEEISTRDNLSTNLMFSEETFQCDGAQNEISAIEEVVVPDKGVSSGLCDDKLPEHMAKEWIPEIKMLDEEEQETPLNETSNQKETKVEMGKAVGEGECGKGLEDINMKDEIKRTLGMLWKKIYQSKQDENFESVELEEKVDDTIKDRLGSGIEHDLNLKGPVELVESPRQKDDVEAFKFSGQSSGNEENRKETSYLKQVQLNGSKTCNSREFISTTGITEEVEGNSSSAFDSCKHQEDENNNWAEETCKWNYIANDVESHSEEIRSSFGSEDSTETAQTHGADESQKGAPETNIPPSDVNKCGLFHSEMVCELEPLPRVDSLVGDAENTQKVKKVFQENVSKEDEMAETTSASEAHQDTDDENYSEDEVEALLADEFSDISCGNSEQQETSSSRQDSKSGSDSEVADDSLSQEFDRKEDKNEIGHGMAEQSSSWKWVFGEELRDKSNKQDEAPDARQLHKEKAKIKKAADEINTRQVTGKAKINDDKPSSMEEGEQEGLQKEVTPEEEAIRNTMRAKERERIAVERAIHEAHERAFIEARERAAMEKDNTEARQKETANGQERSQKTSSEAKLASEKNSLEAKQKAELERAAVERATIEARQRALEKAMSRKVSQSSSSRSTGDSNHQYGSSTEDRCDDDKLSESVLRLKARNDRHQRIAERAAKALAEKNMRDLLVQREQAERNRLAEILDGDVKRWANGKTSNLRALLSTLQYILGPDSGWQPIHLTDIVTTDAVKKAYRKATLFVHPDKLQQRGATIKQTYICEKVFDLLKEAWNRFDRDER